MCIVAILWAQYTMEISYSRTGLDGGEPIPTHDQWWEPRLNLIKYSFIREETKWNHLKTNIRIWKQKKNARLRLGSFSISFQAATQEWPCKIWMRNHRSPVTRLRVFEKRTGSRPYWGIGQPFKAHPTSLRPTAEFRLWQPAHQNAVYIMFRVIKNPKYL